MNLLKPMRLGNRTFPVNIIQGPLAGISCAPFRRLVRRYGNSAFSCTEMISCKTILHQSPSLQKRFIEKDPEEGPVCFQLSSSQPLELAEATKRVTDYGADLIDLNCGCPVKKIRSKGAGSSLLENPTKLYKLITAMKNNTTVPVSIKIRVQKAGDHPFNQDIVNVVKDAGADYLIVHGRHWTEHYETPCRYSEIQYFVEALTIPVIGNGDIACLSSLKTMLQTGCAGVMIGRSGVGRPWLTRQLIAELNNEAFLVPSFKEISLIFMEHVESLIQLLGNEKFAILQARKLGKYYFRHLPNKMEFCDALNVSESMYDIKKNLLKLLVCPS